MSLEIFEHDNRCALVVRAHDPSIDTAHSVLLELSPFDNSIASVFEKALAFVRTVDHVLWTFNS